MKPRLIRIDYLWHCGIKGQKGPLGIAFDKKGAYIDWFCKVKEQWILEWRAAS